MAKYKTNYRVGDLIAIPIGGGEFSAGLIARANKGFLLGYFFEGLWRSIPDVMEFLDYRAKDAVLICRLGDLRLVTNAWTVMGPLPGFTLDAWPVPAFGRVSFLDPEEAFRCEYINDDIASNPACFRISGSEAKRLPEDSLWGADVVSETLAKLCRQR